MDCLTQREREDVVQAFYSGIWDEETIGLGRHAEKCVVCNSGVYLIIDTHEAWKGSAEGRETIERLRGTVEDAMKRFEDP